MVKRAIKGLLIDMNEKVECSSGESASNAFAKIEDVLTVEQRTLFYTLLNGSTSVNHPV